MRWIVFLIFAYIAVGVQVGAAPYLAVGGIAPNLPLLAVVFVAMHAGRQTSILAGFVVGLGQDLLTLQPPGLFALAYAVSGGLMARNAGTDSPTHPAAHVGGALLAGLITAVFLLLHGFLHPVADAATIGGRTLAAVRLPASMLFGQAGYTAILAPLLLWPLERVRGAFAFGRSRRRMD